MPLTEQVRYTVATIVLTIKNTSAQSELALIFGIENVTNINQEEIIPCLLLSLENLNYHNSSVNWA